MVYFCIININLFICIFLLNQKLMVLEIEPQFYESQFYFNSLHYKRVASSI